MLMVTEWADEEDGLGDVIYNSLFFRVMSLSLVDKKVRKREKKIRFDFFIRFINFCLI